MKAKRTVSPLLKLPDELLEAIFASVIDSGTPWDENRLKALSYRSIHPRLTPVVSKSIFKQPVIDAHQRASEGFLHFIFFVRHYQYAMLVTAITIRNHGEVDFYRDYRERFGATRDDAERKAHIEMSYDSTMRKNKDIDAILYMCTNIRTLQITCDLNHHKGGSLPYNLAIQNITLDLQAAGRYLSLIASSSPHYKHIHLRHPVAKPAGNDILYREDWNPQRERQRGTVIDFLFVQGANTAEYCKLLETIHLQPILLRLVPTNRTACNHLMDDARLAESLTELGKVVSRSKFTSQLRSITITDIGDIARHVLDAFREDLQTLLTDVKVEMHCGSMEDGQGEEELKRGMVRTHAGEEGQSVPGRSATAAIQALLVDTGELDAYLRDLMEQYE